MLRESPQAEAWLPFNAAQLQQHPWTSDVGKGLLGACSVLRMLQAGSFLETSKAGRSGAAPEGSLGDDPEARHAGVVVQLDHLAGWHGAQPLCQGTRVLVHHGHEARQAAGAQGSGRCTAWVWRLAPGQARLQVALVAAEQGTCSRDAGAPCPSAGASSETGGSTGWKVQHARALSCLRGADSGPAHAMMPQAGPGPTS